jgi:UDP-N-acetylmuramate dehydrogenase
VVLRIRLALSVGPLSAPIRYAELAGALGVSLGERVPAAQVRAAVLALRRSKAMVLDAADHDTWSVGSFFTNPVVAPDVYERLAGTIEGRVPHYPALDGVKLAAGWLVERAGFTKGYPDLEPCGPSAPCRLSTKHALALTNRGAATTEDVLSLARTIRDGVRDVFGITLKPEPMLVGCVL